MFARSARSGLGAVRRFRLTWRRMAARSGSARRSSCNRRMARSGRSPAPRRLPSTKRRQPAWLPVFIDKHQDEVPIAQEKSVGLANAGEVDRRTDNIPRYARQEGNRLSERDARRFFRAAERARSCTDDFYACLGIDREAQQLVAIEIDG